MPEITTGLLYIEPLFRLAFNLMVGFYHLLGDNLGLAIIVFTLSLKFLTLPFSIRQVNSAKKNKKFQEEYKKIQKKYKNAKGKKKEEMTQELAKLQSQYLPGQIGGCLPLILQVVFFFQVYYVLINLLQYQGDPGAIFNAINYDFIPEFADGATINLDFLNLNLGQSPSGVGISNFAASWPYLLLVLMVGLAQFVSMRVMSGLRTLPGGEDGDGGDGDSGSKGSKGGKGKSKKEKAKNKGKKSKSSKGGKGDQGNSKKDSKGKKDSKDKKDLPEDLSFGDAMAETSKNMMYIFPVMTMVLGLSFPAGLALYWTVSSGFAIIQQLIVNRDKVVSKLQQAVGR